MTRLRSTLSQTFLCREYNGSFQSPSLCPWLAARRISYVASCVHTKAWDLISTSGKRISPTDHCACWTGLEQQLRLSAATSCVGHRHGARAHAGNTDWLVPLLQHVPRSVTHTCLTPHHVVAPAARPPLRSGGLGLAEVRVRLAKVRVSRKGFAHLAPARSGWAWVR